MSDGVRFEWGDHLSALRNVGGACDVEWDQTRRVRTRLLEAVAAHEPLIVYGPVGTGKTFAVARAAEFYCNEINDDCDVLYLRIPATDRGRGLYLAMTEQLGMPTPASGVTETQLYYELSHLVTERERILVVDEAHRLSVRAMAAIHNIADTPGVRATFVLLGAEDTQRRMLEELWSRATACIEFVLLDDASCPTVLGALHPIFANTDDVLLVTLNRRRAKGVLRKWARALSRALQYEIGDRILPEHVDLLFEDL